jgi:hypothetical protein
MKRIVLLIGVLATFLSATESSAQIKYGVKGGLNLSDVVIMDTWRGSMGGSEKDKGVSISNRAGFFIGPTALLNTPLKRLDIDVSLLFDQRGVETKSIDLLGGRPYKTTTTQQQLVLPVNARCNLISGKSASLFVFAGPQLGINIGKRENKTDHGTFVFNRASFSINAGAGLLLARHIQISANYNIVCKKNAETWVNWNTSYANETGRSRFHAWQFSIGYYF